MGWQALIGPLLGAGISGWSAWQQNSRANEAFDQQQGYYDQQMALQNRTLQMAESEYQRMLENDQYMRMMEQLNRQTLQDERDFAMSQYFQNQQHLQEERDYYIRRQTQLDMRAAAERARQIQEHMQNKVMAAEERAYAMQLLEEAQEIARGEKAEDIERFHANQYQAQKEREFAIAEMERKQGIAADERSFELGKRQALEDRFTGLQTALDGAAASLGPMPTLEALTQADIDSTVDRYRDQAMTNMDYVIDRVAGQGEAALIRSGLDGSDPGGVRSRIASQLSNDRQNARLAAEMEALQYITGERGALYNDIANQFQTRSATFNDLSQQYLGGTQQLASLLNSTPSANQYNLDVGIGTGVYDRQIASANNFQAPVPIGSAILSGQFGDGMGQTLTMPSLTQNPAGIPSSVMQPYQQNIMNPQNFYSNAMTGLGNMASGSGQLGQMFAGGAATGWNGLASNLTDLFDEWSSMGSNNNNQLQMVYQPTGGWGSGNSPTYSPIGSY